MFSKKSAVAAAVLLASVAAQAQVSVYGNVDAFFGRLDFPGQDSATTNVESGIHTGSFIGFKGQEDLGGGLKAFFALESDIGLDSGAAGTTKIDAIREEITSNFWGRTSELGLAGDFGTVKLGNSRTLRFLANAAYNPFPVTGQMNTSEFLDAYTGNALVGVPAGFGRVLSQNSANAITYTSPNLSGFTAAVQIGLSEVDGIKNDTALALNYGAGPLAVGFNYSNELDSELARWQLGTSYDFGVAKAFFQYGQNKLDGVDEKQKLFQLGVTVPVSAQGTILASYGNSKIADWKVTDLSVVYDHAMSKRTSAYVGIKNVRDNDADPKNGTSFGVGIKHSF